MAAFLKHLARMLSSGKNDPAVYLAAFGKHPAWNDHIDDLGLDTDDLVNVKRLLYAQGINQNIDTAAWENLDPSQRIDAWHHDFLWYMPAGVGGSESSLIAGQLWSSVDGKGRDKYPIVLCIATNNLPDRFIASVGFPFLTRTHERCVAAATESMVRSVLESDRAALRALIQKPLLSDSLRPEEIVKVARHADMFGREGFHRIVYQIIKGMSLYRPGGAANRRRPEQIRVPSAGLSAADALLFWLRFSLTLLDPTASILLISPNDAVTRAADGTPSPSWVDIIVGEPAAGNLFCIKASPKSLPLTSEIPYTLEPDFTAAVDCFLAACAAADGTGLLPSWPAL